VPRDYTPSYRSCIDLTAHSALHRVLAPAAAALLLPLLLAVMLRFVYGSSNPELVAGGLSAFVIVSAITGLGAALATDGVRSTLGAARRLNRPRSSSSGFAAATSGDAVGHVVGNAAGPAAHLFAKAAAVAALAVSPFLIS
jgi:K(+)-stimulated pyrophosphate-energized sodium pump